MPNRILKESICTSETIDELSPLEETAFYRLLVNCDDYGRMDGRASVLKARLFPLKDIRLGQMSEIINKLASAGLVSLYAVDGKPFVQTVNWDRHQQIRAKKSKYPAPSNDSIQPIAPAIICNQMISDDSNCPRNPIQSVSESQSVSVSERAQEDNHDSPLLSESEMDSLGHRHMDDMHAIEARARQMGMAWAQADEIKANGLIADYTSKWLLEAMNRAAGGQASCRSWRYIEAILKAWAKNGGPDNDCKPVQHVGKRVTEQQYTQRSYGEIDLNQVAARMIAESTQKEQAAQ